MPPGSKKRKAVKKKKEKANNHSTTNNQQVSESDDLITHEEKDSDGGEISSPKSQPENPSITEKEEQGEVDRQGWDSHPSGSVVIEDSKSMEVAQNGTGNGEAKNKQEEVLEEVEVVEDIEVTRELKPEDDEVVKDIQITKELKPDEVYESKNDTIVSVERDAGSFSSSSSSDDESSLVDEKSQVMESEKMEEEEKGGGSVMETTAVVGSVQELEEVKIATSVLDTATDDDLVGTLEKSSSSVIETTHTVDSAEPVVSLTEEVTESFASSTVEDNGVSDEIGLASKDNEEISLPLSNETVGASDVIESVAKESEDKMLQPSDAPIVETSGTGSAELPKDPAIPEISENQPLLGTIPPPIERTSWKSCCGIFDVLKGSNR
ncbi:uncharacterized protein LOC122091080 [Macadamia integrifolia]|uniref:uncharacterized protein LOC122091080 n=1 Tax=Macadamia integrifolia TaxID=60698 RepID=UPI001C4FA6FE|nr:uncharacterized protein LOC122091080 [Macadamia integrifolia]